MKQSKLLLQTLRETPKDADVVSQQLMMRAGMIQKQAAGIYSYFPLAVRSIRKFEQIVREELGRDGCQEILMPAVQPAELWQESGRWTFYGKELLRFQDRMVLPGPHPRGSGHRHGPPHRAQLQAAAHERLPDPGQVPGRDPPPLRPHARPRVHHEGRLLLPRQ